MNMERLEALIFACLEDPSGYPVLSDFLEENDLSVAAKRLLKVDGNEDYFRGSRFLDFLEKNLVLEELRGYDWESAFSAASGVAMGGCDWSCTPTPIPPGSEVSAKPFGTWSVKRVVAAVEGENDGDNWLGVFELHDGRFAMVSAGCDYTGWD